jgi:hypothetical protein
MQNDSPSQNSKFLHILWVTQEVLKQLPPNPPWKSLSHHSRIQELSWQDEGILKTEVEENNHLILRYSRLILSHTSAQNQGQGNAGERALDTAASQMGVETRMLEGLQKNVTNFRRSILRSARKVLKPGDPRLSSLDTAV